MIKPGLPASTSELRTAPTPLVASWEELNRMQELFADPSRPAEESRGPHIIVCDDFYSQDEVAHLREHALAMRFERYCPPEPGRLGELAERLSVLPGTWWSTSVVYFRGRPVRRPFHGARFNPPWLRERLAKAIDETIDATTWDALGDCWNGAFHLIEADWVTGRSSIHHHYKDHDVFPRGWSGLVYLSPDAPPTSGTSIWKERSTGRCVSGYGSKFDPNAARFELALLVENRFNRLVLFRENVLHRAEHGFGHGKTARLTQTFFFRSG